MIEYEHFVRMTQDAELQADARALFNKLCAYKYSYHFTWMGRPIIQFPQDMVAMQELVWQVQPELIIETGIAHGGSLVYYASLLEMMNIDGGKVVGIDIDIRQHNREAIEAHPLMKRLQLIEGSSIAPAIIAQVQTLAAGKRTLVVLDSNHTHAHVLAELEAYAPLTSVGSYCVVMDTVVEDMPAECFPDRPWGPGNNPKTAVHAWLPQHPEFVIDKEVDAKLALTVAPDGYLKRIS